MGIQSLNPGRARYQYFNARASMPALRCESSEFRDTEFLEENAHVPDFVGEGTLWVAVLPLRRGLLPEPTHIVEQDLLVAPALVDICNAAMLDERINCSAIFADGLGIKTTGFAVGEILLGSCCECDPANAVRQSNRALR